MYNITHFINKSKNFFLYKYIFIYLFLKMTTHRLKTQNMVKLKISTNYETRVTVQVQRETMQQTNALCKLI